MRSLLIVLMLTGLVCAEKPKTVHEVSDLWKPHVITTEQYRELARTKTPAQRYEMMLSKVKKCDRDCAKKTYRIKLKVWTVLSPDAKRGKMLIQAKYADKEHQDQYGNATPSLWVRPDQYKVARTLNRGKEFYLEGKAMYWIHNMRKESIEVVRGPVLKTKSQLILIVVECDRIDGR